MGRKLVRAFLSGDEAAAKNNKANEERPGEEFHTKNSPVVAIPRAARDLVVASEKNRLGVGAFGPRDNEKP